MGRGSSETVEGLRARKVTWHHKAVLAGLQDQQVKDRVNDVFTFHLSLRQ